MHTVPSCAWQITESQRLGKFDRQRADELGLDNSEIKILANGEDITTDAGPLSAIDFRSSPREGASLMISGDTGNQVPSFENIGTQGGLDLLMHESTYTDEHEDKARQWMHSTAKDAARAAISTKAKNLLLTHYSSRHEDTQRLLDEARVIHTNTQAATDGDVLIISAGEPIIHLRHSAGNWTQL